MDRVRYIVASLTIHCIRLVIAVPITWCISKERQFHDLRAKTFWLRSFRENTMFVGIDLFLCNFERHIDVDMSPQDVANLLFVLGSVNLPVRHACSSAI